MPQVRIIPRSGFYVVAVIDERAPVPAAVNSALHAGVDMGLNTLALLTSAKPGFVPRAVNGRPVTSIDQVDNKRRAELQSQLGTADTSRRLERRTTKRTRRIDHYLHTASRRLSALLVAAGSGTLGRGRLCRGRLCRGTLGRGKNPLWKQEAHLGRRGNQHFVSVPHARCIALLTYKAALVGIQVTITEASDTSQASFLDADPLPV